MFFFLYSRLPSGLQVVIIREYTWKAHKKRSGLTYHHLLNHQMLQIFVPVPGAPSLLWVSRHLHGGKGKICCRMQIKNRLKAQPHSRFFVWSIWSLKESLFYEWVRQVHLWSWDLQFDGFPASLNRSEAFAQQSSWCHTVTQSGGSSGGHLLQPPPRSKAKLGEAAQGLTQLNCESL